MRRSYRAGRLDETTLAPTWHEQLARWLAEAADAGITEPNAMVLATSGASGTPTARTVLLKGVSPDGLTFFTNLRSRKGRDLAENPRASLVFPWVALERQVVVTGEVESVPDAETDAYWASRPRGSRLGALASPQGEVLPSRAELDEERAKLEARYAPDVEIPRPEHWGGLRVAPEWVEFWQGRPDRLHDRLRFGRRSRGEWVVERLAP